MKKIPSVFERDHSVQGAPYLDRVTAGCEWVLAGEGEPTRKWDGTAVAIIQGVRYARYDAKHGKPPPPDGIPCQEPDPVTGHWPHWVPATRPQDKWIAEAELCEGDGDGTYEACGPKIGGNGERLIKHVLVKHGFSPLIEDDTPRDFEGLKAYLAPLDVEGIVFHHPVAVGGSGKPKGRQRKGPGGELRNWTLAEMCRLQGLPEDFLADAPFTVRAKQQVVGNGVPLFLGSAIARAVKAALGMERAA